MYRVAGFLLLLTVVQGSYFISIYGDVLKDKTFFTRTFPWLIDNVGGYISAEFALLGSGRYSVPQMCVLTQLRGNPFMQAEFLKCEAEGRDPQICLCNTAIDMVTYKNCVQARGEQAGTAAERFAALGITDSPVVEMWPVMRVHGISDEEFLDAICRVFLIQDRPAACDKPLGAGNHTLFPERAAVINTNCNRAD